MLKLPPFVKLDDGIDTAVLNIVSICARSAVYRHEQKHAHIASSCLSVLWFVATLSNAILLT